jgi:two-component sensor histidine kinase
LKRFTLAICSFYFGFYCNAQIIQEPPRGNLVKEDYMTMLIDSLAVADEASDSANVIRYAAILTNEFQTAMMLDRAAFYLQLAFQYARSYSSPILLADVCNRAGMLMPAFGGSPDSPHYEQMIDSSRYWYHQAIHRGLALNQFQIAGWGYRGLLFNAVNHRSHESIRDSIPFYYHNALELATKTGDLELTINCYTQYIYYLSSLGRWAEVGSLLQAQSTRLGQMTTTQKRNFYIQSHDYMAAINRLDTLKKIRELIQHYYQDAVAGRHKEILYAKDQQYEVSRTKSILEKTATRLAATNKILFVSITVLAAFTLLVTYLFYLFRKNKKLSQRNQLLLKEQNHRVKNNLQMVSSLLSLQSHKLQSADAKDALQKSQSRINSVALLHRMLYESDNVGNVQAGVYIQSLTEEIQYSTGREIELELDVPEKLELKIEKLTSLGLIVNELLINSIKHVDQNIVLRVLVRLSISDHRLHLEYEDNGKGVSPERWMTSHSFGSQLIQMQCKQLKGEFEINGERGFRYDLRILPE